MEAEAPNIPIPNLIAIVCIWACACWCAQRIFAPGRKDVDRD